MRRWAWFVAALTLVGMPAAARPLKVMSLDQCADQYVLALAPGADLALSPRSDDPDARMRTQAEGRRRVRPTLEAAIAFAPDVVVRSWGGDARLMRRLKADGVRVIGLADARTFAEVEGNIRIVGRAVNGRPRAGALIHRMNARLGSTAPPQRGAGLYLTAGGFTAGRGTFIDAILQAAGLGNAALAPGFAPVSVERIALEPPRRFVLGFFDLSRADWRGPGRHPVVRRAAQGRVAARLPAAVLTCPAWFAAEAVERVRAGA